MKKIVAAAILMISAFTANAQRHEMGILGGIRSDGAWTGSAGYYFKLGKVQLGPEVEFNGINKTYISYGYTTGTYTSIAPGINVNYLIPITRGFVYPGITAHYQFASDNQYDYRSRDLGVQLGVIIKLVKKLSLNAETGLRTESTRFESNGAGNGRGIISNMIIPAAVGIRLGL